MFVHDACELPHGTRVHLCDGQVGHLVAVRRASAEVELEMRDGRVRTVPCDRISVCAFGVIEEPSS
jgi:16S rRNA U1498 N3-methylase RsmE